MKNKTAVSDSLVRRMSLGYKWLREYSAAPCPLCGSIEGHYSLGTGPIAGDATVIVVRCEICEAAVLTLMPQLEAVTSNN